MKPKNPSARFILNCLMSFTTMGMASSSLHAATVLNFQYGGTSVSPVTNQVDAFTGQAGGGWATDWTLRGQTSASSVFTAGVINASPLVPGGGNYLQVQYARNASGGNSLAGVVRRFSDVEANGGVNMTGAYAISFDFRVDSFNKTSSLNSSTDQFRFSSEITSQVNAFAATAPWRIWYVGGTGWQVGDGNGDGTGTFITIPSLSNITAGLTYEFTVLVNAATNTWDLQIAYNGGNYLASTYNGGNPLGFWTNGVTTSNYLSFRGTRAYDATTNNTMNWSLDSIQVAAIPEPSTALLGLLGIAFLALRRKSLAH